MSVKSYFSYYSTQFFVNAVVSSLLDLWFSKNSRVQAVVIIIDKLNSILSNSGWSVDCERSAVATEDLAGTLFHVCHFQRDLPFG